MKKTNLFIVLIILLSIPSIFAQSSGYNDEEITISKETNFNDAIRTIELLSQQYEGRKIINSSNYTGPINLPIKQVHWKEALQLVVDFNHVVLIEKPGVFQITDPDQIQSSGEEISPSTKQIRISAVFFKLTETFSKNIGIDWSTFLNGEVKANINFRGAESVADELFDVSATERIESGEYTIDVKTLFRIIEAYQEGTILARPNVVVLSGKKGKIQVGEDFSIKTLDEDRNTITEFFSTGIILDVSPTVIRQGDEEAVHLIAKVENSTALPGELTTVISKSQASTEVLLYNNEETVIGGLYDTDVTIVRKGIPILKDLPWWVFGIRYLTGFNKTEKNSGELIILLKVQILDEIEIRRDNSLPTEEQIEDIRIENRDIDKLFEQDVKKLTDLEKE
jgi:type II secretory pathway component GspD/PulD (secretin)